MLPLWATVIGGFKTTGDLRTNAFGLPREWIVDNYVEIATQRPLLADARKLRVHSPREHIPDRSCELDGGVYALPHAFCGKEMDCNYLALGLTFPFATAVLPVFIRVRDLGLLDTYWGVILPQVAFNLGFAVVILQGFFSQLPQRVA